MARKGKSRHLKRISAPSILPVKKKGSVWLKKPLPGMHRKEEAIPLGVLLRDVLGVAETMKEAKKLLKSGEVLVDGKQVREEGFGVGVMDVVSIPKLGKNYRVLLVKDKLRFFEIPQEEAGIKLCKIVDKKIVGNSRIQLNLHDGRNYVIEKEEDQFKTGDTLRMGIPGQKLEGFLKLEKGARCYIAKGRHAGEIAVLDDILERAGSKESDARLHKENGSEIITLKSYLFVVDSKFQIP
ncbi:30S ribosomal protein S4e [Candidatus Micrarchaeota archaeon]|nr:30S ribosomal protein S4e [Candidatus Micrarchaeota archaeon]